MPIYLVLDASGYPIEAYETEADARAECDRRNYHNNGLRVLKRYVHKAKVETEQ